MNFDPGKVTITLYCTLGRVRDAAVACQRPGLTALLRGRPADEAVHLIPRVYALCGRAQGTAAQAALAAARGNERDAEVDVAVQAEAAREHAWKLLVDWPGQLGLAPDQAFFVRLIRAEVAERPLLAAALTQHPLPDRLSALAGEGRIARLLAERIRWRLQELLAWLNRCPGVSGTVAAHRPSPGCGEATVETARGPLQHRIELAGDAVAAYEISAPTDRSFAEDGLAASHLTEVIGVDHGAAVSALKRLIMALDPCVPCACTRLDDG